MHHECSIRLAYSVIRTRAFESHQILSRILLAVDTLTPIGFTLSIDVRAILMLVSTLVDAPNANLVRRLDLRPTLAHGCRTRIGGVRPA